MKLHSILLVTFILCAIIDLTGQSNRQVEVGFKTGINYYDIYGINYMDEPSGIIGYTPYFALFINRNLSDRFSLNLEALYSWSEDWHFVELPIHKKYKVFNRIYLFGGPKLDVLVYEFIAGESKRVAISTDVGVAGYLTKRLFIELRHSYGISEQLYDPYDFDLGRRNTFRAGVGFHF
jgi:hypothetical protein